MRESHGLEEEVWRGRLRVRRGRCGGAANALLGLVVLVVCEAEFQARLKSVCCIRKLRGVAACTKKAFEGLAPESIVRAVATAVVPLLSLRRVRGRGATVVAELAIIRGPTVRWPAVPRNVETSNLLQFGVARPALSYRCLEAGVCGEVLELTHVDHNVVPVVWAHRR